MENRTVIGRRCRRGGFVRFRARVAWVLLYALMVGAAAHAQPFESLPPWVEAGSAEAPDPVPAKNATNGSRNQLASHAAPAHGDLLVERHRDVIMPNGPISPYLLPGAHVEPIGASIGESDLPPPTYCRCLTPLGFRHSYTHGRNVGWGKPMVGTSWLNRPYYTGATLGPFWIPQSVARNVSGDTDLMGSVFFGWDWDYYWGSEFEYAYATPQLVNREAPDASLERRLAHWNYSLLYYPWGDATWRPYWSLGVGNTKFDFPNDAGIRRDQWLLTFPFGIGFKYPLRRWLVSRVEFIDQFSIGANGMANQHNLSLMFGLECHYGARPGSYWPWNPSSFIW